MASLTHQILDDCMERLGGTDGLDDRAVQELRELLANPGALNADRLVEFFEGLGKPPS